MSEPQDHYPKSVPLAYRAAYDEILKVRRETDRHRTDKELREIAEVNVMWIRLKDAYEKYGPTMRPPPQT